jgi:hypothetical protein
VQHVLQFLIKTYFKKLQIRKFQTWTILKKKLFFAKFCFRLNLNLPKNTRKNNLERGAFLMKVCIICFKIKNPPTLHSTRTSKIQPTMSPTFVFSVLGSVKKMWGYEIKLLTVVLVVVHRVY